MFVYIKVFLLMLGIHALTTLKAYCRHCDSSWWPEQFQYWIEAPQIAWYPIVYKISSITGITLCEPMKTNRYLRSIPVSQFLRAHVMATNPPLPLPLPLMDLSTIRSSFSLQTPLHLGTEICGQFPYLSS